MWKRQTDIEKVYPLLLNRKGLPRLSIRNRQTVKPNTLGYLYSRQDDIQICFGVHLQTKTIYPLNRNRLSVSNQTYLLSGGDINPVVHIARVACGVICCSVRENQNQTTSRP